MRIGVAMKESSVFLVEGIQHQLQGVMVQGIGMGRVIKQFMEEFSAMHFPWWVFSYLALQI